jgi:putative ABC transport system substrate-binding protein
LEFLQTVVPKLSRVAVLKSPGSPAADLQNLQTAVQKAGVDALVIEASTVAEIENAFTRIAQERVRGAIFLASSTFSTQRHQIAELAIRNRMPSVFTTRSYAEAGALISYGSDYADQVRSAATLVDKILNGAKPGDLPVEQATKLELFINLKTAKAIGITIPKELLLRADQVIE